MFWRSIVLLGAIATATTAAEPRFSLSTVNANKNSIIRADGLTDIQWSSLKVLSQDRQKLNEVLQLFIVDDQSKSKDRQSIFGECQLDEKTHSIIFTPRYPLTDGLSFTAELRLPASTTPNFKFDFHIPKIRLEPSSKVLAIYPTASQLPENLLKFYIHFSAPMSGGDVYRFIELVSDDGKHIEHPFLEIAEELWDPKYQRLTLLLDPARVKQGLVPHDEDGAILFANKKYRLTINPKWEDATGTPMSAGFTKDFECIKADYTQPNPDQWKITPPKAGSRDPLSIELIEALDHAIVTRGIVVLDARDQVIPGDASLSEQERAWNFLSDEAWKPGIYQLRIDDRIEDLVGNSIERPFELDRFDKVEPPQPKHIRLKFEVKTP